MAIDEAGYAKAIGGHDKGEKAYRVCWAGEEPRWHGRYGWGDKSNAVLMTFSMASAVARGLRLSMDPRSAASIHIEHTSQDRD